MSEEADQQTQATCEVAADAASSTPLVIVVPLDTADSSLADLRAAGVITIKTDKPDAVRMLMPGGEIRGGDMLMSVLKGLCHTPHCGSSEAKEMRSVAMVELFTRLQARETRE